MTTVSTYLNFAGQAEEAFGVYASLMDGRITSMTRFSDAPFAPELPEAERSLIMNIQMTIFGSHVLMATDLVESLGQVVRIGNNTTLNLELDSSDLVDRIYAGLVFDGTEFQAPAPAPWAAYWGVVLDRFGIRWMLSHAIAPMGSQS